MKKYFFKLLLVATITMMSSLKIYSQSEDWKNDKKANLLFGLIQPLSGGFNVEGNYIYKRFIFDYSHGVSLDFKESNVTDELEKQGVAVHIPYTTGFGIGYRIKEWINVRIEPKWHRFEFYYNDEPQNESNRITSYNTFTLGIGIYGSYQPFKKKENFLKGILITPSVRFWPTVSSSLDDDEYTYFNKNTQQNEKIKTLDPGVGFSPIIFNVSIGYTFDLKRKNNQ